MAFNEVLRLVLDVDAAKGKREVDDFTKKTSTNLARVGSTMSRVGGTLTRDVTLPILGVGVAATKMALDFDSVFVQMQTLAGATAGEVDGMKQSVLDLAGQTGKAPRELAEALYFLRSSGLDSAQAMEALEISAKGSAAGLGSTIQVADAVSSAMNAYAKSGLSAAEATDVLVATAREGKVEPAELAKQMGRLLPLSSELGISFQDVGAALAGLSLSGNDAAGASTLLSNVMAKLLKPSQQAVEIMSDVGIGLDDIRSMIAEKGLLGTLETLRKSLGDAGFARFLEDAQAVQGGLALTGENVEKNREIFDALNDSVGATEDAFATWAESMGAENAQAWAQFQAAMIRLGDTLAPIATDLISFAAGLIEVFDGLPDPVKRAAAALVIVAAAAGPLLSVGGRLLTIWAALAKTWGATAMWASGGQAFANAMNSGSAAAGLMSTRVGGLISLGGKFAVFTAGIIAAGKALDALFPVKEYNLDKVANDLVKFEKTGRLTGDAMDMLGEDFEKLRKASEHLFDASLANKADSALDTVTKFGGALGDTKNQEAGRFLEKLDETLASIAEIDPDVAAELFATIEAEMKKAGATTDEVAGRFDKYTSAVARSDTATELAADSVGEGAEAFDEQTAAINDAAAALAGYADALQAQFDPLFAIIDAHKGMAEARRAVDDATVKLAEAEKKHGAGSAEAAAAVQDLVDAQDAAVSSAFDLEGAQIGLAESIQNGSVTLDDAIGWLQRWVADGRITQAEADAMAFKFAAAAGELKSIPRQWNSHLTVSGVEDSIHNIDTIQQRINNMRGRDVGIRIVGTSVGVVLPGGARFMAGGGRLRKGEGAFVGEEGVEWFQPDKDGTIVPHHMLGNMVPHSSLNGSGGGGGGTARVTIDLTGGDSEFVRWLRNRVRVEGGDVQVVLGRGR